MKNKTVIVAAISLLVGSFINIINPIEFIGAKNEIPELKVYAYSVQQPATRQVVTEETVEKLLKQSESKETYQVKEPLRNSNPKTGIQAGGAIGSILDLSFGEQVMLDIIQAVQAEQEQRYAKHITFTVDDIKVDLNQIMDLYFTSTGYETTLHKDKNDFIMCCTDFFVTQMGMNPTIAAGLIGNCLREGYFGQLQGPETLIQDYNTYIKGLDSRDGRGYGIVQWTTQHRQDKLKATINEMMAYMHNKYSISYDELKKGKYYPYLIVASELKFAYLELRDYKIFKSYDKTYSVEDACGRIAKYYEGYKESSWEWKTQKDGSVKIAVKYDCSGTQRLQCAKDAYEYMKTLGRSK